MKSSAIAILLVSMSLAGCDKEESKSVDAASDAKPEKVEDAAELAAPVPSPAQKAAEPAPPSPPGADMSAVHAQLKAGSKLGAVKAYRDQNNKMALYAAKLGVEVEQHKLGMPSPLTAHKLYFEGKNDEARKALAAQYGMSPDDESIVKLWKPIDAMGPATQENLKAQVAAGKKGAALAIYHHLNPETPIPEAWRAVEAMKP